MTPLLWAYGGVARLALPFVARAERRKLAQAGMSNRFREKLGISRLARPEGRLIWVHAASVGESLSALTLIQRLTSHGEILVTTGTATSATLMADRLPPGARHQFAPLDAPGPVARFLDHWRPNGCVLIESELWPNTIQAVARQDLPLALVNARLSDRSLASWQKRPNSARAVLSSFSLILTQTDELAMALQWLGAPKAQATVNLKSLAAPLPVKPDLVAAVPKPAWVAASTHPGEEELVLAAHAALLETHPDLTLLLVPRHPARGSEIAASIKARGWPAPRRSQGDEPDGPVWLLDTLGELGSFYAAAPVVFLGGSLVPVGGHNPFEPAHAAAALLSGPHVDNFKDTFSEFTARGAARIVEDPEGLAREVDALLTDAEAIAISQRAARAIAKDQVNGIDRIEALLLHALKIEV